MSRCSTAPIAASRSKARRVLRAIPSRSLARPDGQPLSVRPLCRDGERAGVTTKNDFNAGDAEVAQDTQWKMLRVFGARFWFLGVRSLSSGRASRGPGARPLRPQR